MSYEKRRYRVVNGKLEKAFNSSDADGWVRSKAEAWANAGKPPVEVLPGLPKRGRPRKSPIDDTP